MHAAHIIFGHDYFILHSKTVFLGMVNRVTYGSLTGIMFVGMYIEIDGMQLD